MASGGYRAVQHTRHNRLVDYETGKSTLTADELPKKRPSDGLLQFQFCIRVCSADKPAV
jgi:hypothetical protein